MHVSLSLSCRLRERNGNGNKNKARECDLQEHKNNYDSKRNEHIYARWLVFTFEIKCEMDIMSVLLMYIVALRVEVLVYLIWLAKCRDTQRVSDSGKIHVHLLPAASWLSCYPDWQLWSAWHSPLLPLIFYLTCLLCINMEEPQKKPERETESKPATATAPALSHSHGNSFICVASSAVAWLSPIAALH